MPQIVGIRMEACLDSQQRRSHYQYTRETEDEMRSVRCSSYVHPAGVAFGVRMADRQVKSRGAESKALLFHLFSLKVFKVFFFFFFFPLTRCRVKVVAVCAPCFIRSHDRLASESDQDIDLEALKSAVSRTAASSWHVRLVTRSHWMEDLMCVVIAPHDAPLSEGGSPSLHSFSLFDVSLRSEGTLWYLCDSQVDCHGQQSGEEGLESL